MLITSRTVALIQKAGQAIDGASTDLSETVHKQGRDMLTRVAQSPFGADSEQALERFRQITRLGQELLTVEQQLRAIYASATALSVVANEDEGLSSTHSIRATAASPQRGLKAAGASARPKAVPAPAHSTAGQPLSANDEKLLAYLKTVLKKGAWTRLHGQAVCTGSGLPVGSVGASMRRLLAAGAVNKGARAMYRLAD